MLYTKTMQQTSIQIAHQARMQSIEKIAAKLGIAEQHVERYGKFKAKIDMSVMDHVQDVPTGKLVLVSAMTPTPAGEGKTTTTIGLGDALNRVGKKTTICLREPSMGPCFGLKGGATGGGRSQVVPMEDINLHFNGDMHAIGVAHNLLAAMIDNHIHQGNQLGIDPRRVSWQRVVDMSDRALRKVVTGLGGIGNSVPRESSFDITVASEVMAIFCLIECLAELPERLGRIIVAQTSDRQPVTAAQLKAHGAMTALLRDAIKPNLVQTLENNPAIIHGGPFANIAHGCNSVIATKLAMRLSEYTVTEAGFGADLGAEKFIHIKCRRAGIMPHAVVLVTTVRALKIHGAVSPEDLDKPNVGAVEMGLANLEKHIENLHHFHLPVVVAVNQFATDTDDELRAILDCDYLGVQIIKCDHWARGGAGACELAEAVVQVAEHHHTNPKFLYEEAMPLWQKVRTIAREIYGADDIEADKRLRNKFHTLQNSGFGHLPVCIAKTQYSLSTDPGLKGRPRNFNVPLRDVKVCAGAGFVLVLTGDVLTMPGLPPIPSAEAIGVDEDGKIVGLF